MGIDKDIGGIGVGAVARKLVALVVAGKRVGAEARAG